MAENDFCCCCAIKIQSFVRSFNEQSTGWTGPQPHHSYPQKGFGYEVCSGPQTSWHQGHRTRDLATAELLSNGVWTTRESLGTPIKRVFTRKWRSFLGSAVLNVSVVSLGETAAVKNVGGLWDNGDATFVGADTHTGGTSDRKTLGTEGCLHRFLAVPCSALLYSSSYIRINELRQSCYSSHGTVCISGRAPSESWQTVILRGSRCCPGLFLSSCPTAVVEQVKRPCCLYVANLITHRERVAREMLGDTGYGRL